MEANKENKQQSEYNDLEEAIKNKGIFVDNFGNKIAVANDPLDYDDDAPGYLPDIYNRRYYSIAAHTDEVTSIIKLKGDADFSIPVNEQSQKNQYEYHEVFYGKDSKLYCLQRIKSGNVGFSDSEDYEFEYDGNYVFINNYHVPDPMLHNKMMVYKKDDNGIFKQECEFNLPARHENILFPTVVALGVIDQKFYFRSADDNKIFRFNRYGQRETTINLPKGIENTHTTLKALFNEIKTRYNDALRQHKINVDTDIDEIIQEVLLNHATASTIENNLDSANKNKKLGI